MDEVWGSNGLTYNSDFATVYSGAARLLIQKLTVSRDDPTLDVSWDGDQWVGDYRITFVVDANAPIDLNTSLRHAVVRPKTENGEEVVITEEPDLAGGTAYVVGEHNLTYIDVRLTESKGGSGGGTNPTIFQKASLPSPTDVRRRY